MSFLVDGLLKSTANYFSQAKGPFSYSSNNNFTGTFSNSLKITSPNNSQTSDELQNSEVATSLKRDNVESRASSSLLNSSLAISKRQLITDSVASTVNTLNNLNEEINQEVNPLRKSDLISEAETILTDLNTYLTNEFNSDSNLPNAVTVTSLTPSTSGGTFTNVDIQGVSNISELGITSLNFTDYQTTADALNSASLILAQKQSSYSSSTTSVSTAIDKELKKFNAEVVVLAESDKEQATRDLSNSVATSIFNFTIQNTTTIDTVATLLNDQQDKTDKTDENKDENPATITRNNDDLNNLTTNQSSASYLVPDSSQVSDSSISVEA